MVCRLSLSGKAFLTARASHRYGCFTKLAAAASQLYSKVSTREALAGAKRRLVMFIWNKKGTEF